MLFRRRTAEICVCLSQIWCFNFFRIKKTSKVAFRSIVVQEKIDRLERQQNQMAAEAAQLQSSFSLKQMQETAKIIHFSDGKCIEKWRW